MSKSIHCRHLDLGIFLLMKVKIKLMMTVSIDCETGIRRELSGANDLIRHQIQYASLKITQV